MGNGRYGHSLVKEVFMRLAWHLRLRLHLHLCANEGMCTIIGLLGADTFGLIYQLVCQTQLGYCLDWVPNIFEEFNQHVLGEITKIRTSVIGYQKKGAGRISHVDA